MAAMSGCFYNRKFSLFNFTDCICLNDFGFDLVEVPIDDGMDEPNSYENILHKMMKDNSG